MANLDKNKINERIEVIKKEMEATKTTFIKLEGHLTEAMHWLSEFDNSKEKTDGSDHELINMEEC